MAKKVKLTRPELRRQRDDLERFQRYLPTLELKQQQLQLTLGEVAAALRKAREAVGQARAAFEPHRGILGDVAGVNVRELAKPGKIHTATKNVAGVRLPVFGGVDFAEAAYSLFATPAWVDRVLAELREISRRQAEVDVLQEQYDLLRRELTKVIQRVNLFDKVKIPEAKEAIRVIRIRLGDEMTAAVGRAKIAKNKIEESESEIYG